MALLRDGLPEVHDEHLPAALHACARLISPRLAHDLVSQVNFAWTDLTYLLHGRGISWRYYVSPGRSPDCAGGAPWVR